MARELGKLASKLGAQLGGLTKPIAKAVGAGALASRALRLLRVLGAHLLGMLAGHGTSDAAPQLLARAPAAIAAAANGLALPLGNVGGALLAAVAGAFFFA